MKIWGNIPKVNGVYNKQNRVESTKKTSSIGKKNDEISISSQARDFQTVMKALKDVPDIREDRVNDVSQKIESGNYQVEAKNISAKILAMMTSKNA